MILAERQEDGDDFAVPLDHVAAVDLVRILNEDLVAAHSQQLMVECGQQGCGIWLGAVDQREGTVFDFEEGIKLYCYFGWLVQK